MGCACNKTDEGNVDRTRLINQNQARGGGYGVQVEASFEPEVSAMLQDIAAKHGALLEGLKYKLLGRESLLRKIDKAVEQLEERMLEYNAGDVPPIDAMDVVSSMEDAFRYTMVVPSATYATVVEQAMVALEGHGYQPVGLRNYCPVDKGDASGQAKTQTKTQKDAFGMPSAFGKLAADKDRRSPAAAARSAKDKTQKGEKSDDAGKDVKTDGARSLRIFLSAPVNVGENQASEADCVAYCVALHVPESSEAAAQLCEMFQKRAVARDWAAQ